MEFLNKLLKESRLLEHILEVIFVGFVENLSKNDFYIAKRKKLWYTYLEITIPVSLNGKAKDWRKGSKLYE